MQKPQPVRPSSTSAFSAYVPARGLGTASPSKNQNNYDSSPDSPPRSFSSSYSKPSYSYSSSPSKTTRDFQSLNRQSPPKISGTLTRPTALSLMTNSDYNPGKVGFSICLHFQILVSLCRGRIWVLVWEGKEAFEPRRRGEIGKNSSLLFLANQVQKKMTQCVQNGTIHPNQVNLQQHQHQQPVLGNNNNRVRLRDSATSAATPSQCLMFDSAASVGLNASTAKP